MAITFPRVLFITPCAFNNVTGTGITFSNLFRGWPKANIGTVHMDIFPVSYDVCCNYYFLTEKEIKMPYLLRRLLPSKISQNSGNQPEFTSSSTKKNILKYFKSIIFGNSSLDNFYFSYELKKWIDNFKPDLIFSILGSNSMMQLVNDVVEYSKIPLVIHIMDNWIATQNRGGLLSYFPRRKMNRLFSSLIDRSELCFSISSYMSDEYQKIYGKHFIPFQNTVDIEKWGKYSKIKTDLNKNNIKLLYVGSIFKYAQLSSLVDCCKAIAELKKRGYKITFDIYSPRLLSGGYRNLLVVDDCISLNDSITDDLSYFKIVGEADLLILPVNFDSYTVEYIRFSMPTKVPSYLMSGTPVFVYGPDSVAQVKYALKEKWGYVVSQEGVDKVIDGLIKILNDGSIRTEISNNAQKTAKTNHDSLLIRERFQSCLKSLYYKKETKI